MKSFTKKQSFEKSLLVAPAMQPVLAPMTPAEQGVLEEVVVSVQLREQSLTEVPISVEVFG